MTPYTRQSLVAAHLDADDPGISLLEIERIEETTAPALAAILVTAFARLASRIGELEHECRELRDEISHLDDLPDTCETLQEDVQELESRCESLGSDADGLSGRVHDLELLRD